MKILVKKRNLKYLDLIIPIDIILIVIFGVLNIYSTTYTSSGFYYAGFQIIWAIIGLATAIFLIMVDYSVIKNYANIIYWLSVLLLFYNDVISKSVKGASSWIRIGSRAIEPGEFVRIGLILMLAKKIDDMGGDVNNRKNLLVLMFYSFIPILLIVIQPNLGLTMICLFILFGMLFISGLKLKTIFYGFISVIPLSLLIWFSGLLKTYQKNRIVSFLNPGQYQQDIAYQLNQSLIGIGSGRVFGKGFLKGTLISSGYIPEVHTDFIFASVGEEWGFIGCIFLIVLFSILIIRLIKLSKETENIMARLVCIGVASSFIFSVLQNIGMTIGIMPIAGITLPFMSYGGSSIVANFISVGLALSMGMKKGIISF